MVLTPRPRLNDTSRDAQSAQYSRLRRIPAWRRLALMDDLTGLAQAMCRAGLKRRHPEASESDIDALYCGLVLGPELAAKVLEHRRIRLAQQTP